MSVSLIWFVNKFIYYIICLKFYLLSSFFFFLGPHPQHMEVPRLGVKLEPQPLAYTIVTATWDPDTPQVVATPDPLTY